MDPTTISPDVFEICLYFGAGTEVNNELCTHVPGPACDETSGNQMGGPVEGFIHVHRGIRGVGDISADDYAWINPVAKIFISERTEV